MANPHGIKAMLKDLFKDLAIRVFLIHLAAFVAGTLICAAVNVWLTPGTLWVQWVALGWGAAVATHAFALFLRKTRRRERIFIDRKRAELCRPPLRLCGDGADPSLRQRHRDAKSVVVLLGGARLGRRHPLPWLVRLLQAKAEIAVPAQASEPAARSEPRAKRPRASRRKKKTG